MRKASFSILKTLAYYNIFNYPLTKEEIISMMDADYSQDDIRDAFYSLENEKLIFYLDGFYSLYNNSFFIQRRKKGNERAKSQFRIAAKVAKLLSHFPYVKAIAVSGSLSKDFADENSDIDLFIITAKDRLWIARTFMHLFKKLTYLIGKQDWFCMNYYVDEAALEIREKNIYTAVEVITAVPLRSDTVLRDFVAANEWTKRFFPNRMMKTSNSKKIGKGFFKLVIETIFNNLFGDWLNTRLMKITLQRWKKKTERKKRNGRGIIMGMDGGLHYCKPDPRYFQEKVVQQFDLKIEQLMHELQPYSAIKAV